MSLPNTYNPIFRDHIKQHQKPYHDAEKYGVKIVPVTDPSQPHWRVIGIHHLTSEETGGLHTVFYDLLDKDGKRVTAPAVRFQKGNSEPERVQENKPPHEPAGNMPIFKEDVVSLFADWPDGAALPSERVTNLTTQHPDEGPGATLFHHAFYVVWQRSEGQAPPVELPVEPPVVEPIEEPPTLVEQLWAMGRPLILPLDRESSFYQTAQSHKLGDRLTVEYEATYQAQTYQAQIFEQGLVYAPADQIEQIKVDLLSKKPIDEDKKEEGKTKEDTLWSNHITGFFGTRWEYWAQQLQGKVAELTWPQFLAGVVSHNPQLEADNWAIKSDKVYVMPRLPNQTAALREQPAVVINPDRPGSGGDNGQQRKKPVSAAYVRRTKEGQFLLKDKPARFIGVNIRGLVHYGHIDLFGGKPLELQREQLRQAKAMNARLVRVFLPHKDATPKQVAARLATTINLLKKEFPDIYLLPALTNLYNDVPFYVKGDTDFYQPQGGDGRDILTKEFYQKGYKKNYLKFVKHIVTAFKDEPQIFAWEIGNELKAEGDPQTLVTFMTTVAKTIKDWDSNHLVTTGMISTRHAFMAKTDPLRDKLYGSPNIDFITIHAYNGNENPDNIQPPPIEDDRDLAAKFKKPFIIEEAGYDRTKYGDRPAKTRGDLMNWFRAGASGYLPWGFVASHQDNGDGDRNVGMTRPLHGDWDQLFHLFKTLGNLLLNSSISSDISQALANIPLASPAATMPAADEVAADEASIDEVAFGPEPVILPWPLETDGFDFPVGKPDANGYYVATDLVDPEYHAKRGFWHTGEDWNGNKFGDTDLGDPVYAIAHGRVVTAHKFKTWGNIVLLEHLLPSGGKVWSQYAHLQQRYVRKGDIVRRGEPIGTIGKGDDDQFVAHLHFEIRRKKLPASKWGYKTEADREALLRDYVHPSNFIKGHRPGG